MLDACVLVPPVLCDLLLRLAERPALYRPRWSSEIMAEVRRNQAAATRLSPERIESWHRAVPAAFPGALVTGWERWERICANDPKDRHVLACAIEAEASIIVTANVRDFPEPTLRPWNVRAVPPDLFVTDLARANPEPVGARLRAMAEDRRWSRERTISALARSASGPEWPATLAALFDAT